MKIHYTVGDIEFDEDLYIEVHQNDILFGYESIAIVCAYDYYDNHDGWECKWPLDFYLYTLNSETPELVASYNIKLEFEPTFYAYERK